MVIIKDVNEERKEESEYLVTNFQDHNLGTLLEISNKDKSKGILVNDETTINIGKQLSTIINTTYKHNLGWSKEEYEIKLEALLDA